MKVFLCAICNINSGTCSEDCKFCTQSVKHGAKIDRYTQKPIELVVQEAQKAKSSGALGFCLVSAHKALDEKILKFVCECADAINSRVDGLRLIACNGTATLEQLITLKDAGIKAYNHNLETSKEFYSNICTTHSWQERYETCLNINRSGLKLISGGIFGLGESRKDRVSMLESIRSLEPVSVPINFYHPNPSLPLSPEPLSVDEALELISLTKEIVNGADRVMVAGGREITFADRWSDIFKAGANAIVIGDYLTTKGAECGSDLETIKSLGFEIASDV